MDRQERPKVVVVNILGSLDTGGAELRALDVLRRLGTEDLAFNYVALSGRPGELAPTFEQLGATVDPLRLDFAFPVKFIRHLRRNRVEVVHSHVALFSGLILMLAAIARVPVRIAHLHSDGDGQADSWRRRQYRRLMRGLVDRCATHVIGVSPSALSQGYKSNALDDPRSRVLPNGFDARDLLAARVAPAGTLRLLSLGRCSPEKNIPRMLPIVQKIRDLYSDVHLDIVGPRNEEIDTKLRAHARRLGVEQEISLKANTADVPRELASHDVLLLTSTREGLPSVVLEAAAVGLPVVSSDVGGSVWISQCFAWVHCLSLEASDEEWAQAVVRAARNAPSRSHAMAAFERSIFTLDAVVKELRTIYMSESVAPG